MSLSKKYKKSKDMKWCMRFKTFHPEGDNFDGVVTNIQKNLIVLREAKDFDFDGVVILPKKILKGYRDGKFERCFNRVLCHNSNIKKVKSLRWLDNCTDLKQILYIIQKKNIWPVVEIIYKPNGKVETEFYIGKITRIEKKSFWIYDYSAAGKWQGEWEIGYDEIFKIEFDDDYSRHFNAFMQTRLPKDLKDQ